MFDFLKDVGGWLSSNKDWLKPAASVATGLYQVNAQNDARQKLSDFYRQQESDDYLRQLDERNAELAYRSQLLAAAAAGRGGGGGGGGGNSRAKAAALTASLNKEKDILRPFYESTMRSMPMRESLYTSALNNLGGLAQNQLPELLSKWGSTTSAMNVPLGVM